MTEDHSQLASQVLCDRQVVFLDIVRGLAASCVLLHHILLLIGRPELAHGIPLGSLGVTTFFLLSGFLIDQSARRRAASDYTMREFLIDRVARIYICYVPALALTAILVGPLAERADFVGEPHHGIVHFLGNLLMLQDYPAFQIARRAGLDLSWFVRPYALGEPYWTVPIELYLYVGFGVVYFYYIRRSSVPRRGVLIAAGIALLPVLYHAATGYGECLTWTWLLGVLGSRLMSTGLARPKASFIAIWLAVACLLLGLRQLSRGQEFYDLQKAMFLGMVLMGGLWGAARVRWLTQPVIKASAAYWARTSYPLYLTHNVLIGWTVMHLGKDLSALELTALVVCCHACAFIFWWAFDRHHKWVAVRLRNSTAPPQPAGAVVRI